MIRAIHCTTCGHAASSPFTLADHINANHPERRVKSLEANRETDPTPDMHDTRVTPGAVSPRFRRGDWVINAKDWMSVTGVRPEGLAEEVIDIQFDWVNGGKRWKLTTKSYGPIKETSFVLLEHIEEWTPDASGAFWTRTHQPQS